MAAPATTARVAPTGIMLRNGYQTHIGFARDSNVDLWEREVQPIGYDGGDAIDTTTMHNTTYATMAERALIDITEGTMTCGYDPGVVTQILSLININGAITVTFPDGSTLDFYGYLRTFIPQSMSRGNLPEAECALQPTNWDPDNNVEQGPVITSVAGT